MSTSQQSPALYRIDWKSTDLALHSGLQELLPDLKQYIAEEGDPISFVKSDLSQGFIISTQANKTVIQYDRPCDAFRGLASLLAGIGGENLQESTSFSSLGVMLDLSRGAVLHVDGIKHYFRQFALMGINTVQLYMEDVYQLQKEPFFGYCRGAYSPEELKEIDDYGDLLGIEVIPCIQTLGHLEQILQWADYQDLVDVKGVLLVGAEKTYALIAKMLDTLMESFRTRRFHIGMDEAQGVGQGKYRKLHGSQRAFDVLNTHLNKVMELCRERDIQPMIWSDMYFRIGSETSDYYDLESVIPSDVASKIPTDVELVYWDYYHTDAGFYKEWIKRHRSLGKEPIFAAGAWTWGRFWPHYAHAFATIRAGMQAAKEEGVAEAFLTVWGDDGNECDPFAVLPSVQFFADYAYDASLKTQEIGRRFAITCQGDWDVCLLGAEIDYLPDSNPIADMHANPGKWILWHDPLTNFLGNYIPLNLLPHYENLVSQLKEKATDVASDLHYRFIIQLAEALLKKLQLHLQLGTYYRTSNKEGLRELFATTLPDTIKAIEMLFRLHRKIWFAWRKPFGWETLEYRYAGVLSRLRTLQHSLRKYLAGDIKTIAELEFEPAEPPNHTHIENVYFGYARTSSPHSSRW